MERSQILDFMSSADYSPLKSKELAAQLGVGQSEYKAFRSELRRLEAEGIVSRLKGGKWKLPKERKNELTGTIQIKKRGFGFFIPDDPHIEDVFVPEDELGDSMSGDKVAIRIRRSFGGRGHRKFGVVDRIIERAVKRLVGTVEKHGKSFFCIPEVEQFSDSVLIEDTSGLKMTPGQKILLELTDWPVQRTGGKGRALELLGPAGEPDTETAAILASFDAPGEFPQEVLNETASLSSSVDEHEMRGRLDLRDLICFTIDPDDAKDFDDAISVERTRDGFKLGVHIADVSHYVRPGSALYEEAVERSTSIYLPARVIPMIPPELSNDLCSLRPNEDRRTMTVFLYYDKDVNLQGFDIHRSIINSKKRLTYNQAKNLLEDDAAAEAFENTEVLSSLRTLRTLTKKMREKRLKNGSIELNLPEYKVVIDEDSVASGMMLVEHDFSHQMVEDCMLAANVAVAKYAEKFNLPVLYRVHEAPEDESLRDMAEFLESYGYRFSLPFSRKRLNAVIKAAHGTPEEHAINLAILTSMQQAVYAPEKLGHFALAFDSYAHFTSPIRRFPDLHLHLRLKEMLSDTEHELPTNDSAKRNGSAISCGALVALGHHTSSMERRAMKIENEIKDLRRLELLSKSDRKFYKAIVTGIRDFGIFVEIEDFFVEGMLHKTALYKHGCEPIEVMPVSAEVEKKKDKGKKKKKDKKRNQASYERSARSSRGFHLGEEIVVEVTEVSMTERRCQMEYVGRIGEVDSI